MNPSSQPRTFLPNQRYPQERPLDSRLSVLSPVVDDDDNDMVRVVQIAPRPAAAPLDHEPPLTKEIVRDRVKAMKKKQLTVADYNFLVKAVPQFRELNVTVATLRALGSVCCIPDYRPKSRDDLIAAMESFLEGNRDYWNRVSGASSSHTKKKRKKSADIDEDDEGVVDRRKKLLEKQQEKMMALEVLEKRAQAIQLLIQLQDQLDEEKEKETPRELIIELLEKQIADMSTQCR